MSQLKVAIISFAHMHAASYAHGIENLPDVKFVAIADDDPKRLEMTRDRYKTCGAFYSDFREMLDKEEIDAVIICSANSDHAEIAIECAARKKHILCEKPLAITVEDGVAIIKAARDNGVKLMTAFPIRFNQAIHEAKKMIQCGKIGRVLGAATSNHGSMPGGWFVDPAKSGGGAVMDHTVHVADLLRWMLEDEVDEVYAEYDRLLHDIPSEDCGQLMLRFTKGTVVSLDTSWSRPKSYSIWGDVKMEIKGEKGNLSINCCPRTLNIYRNETMRHTTVSAGDNHDDLLVREFVDAVREDREPFVTGLDGLRAVEVALAAYEAGKRREVVKLNRAEV